MYLYFVKEYNEQEWSKVQGYTKLTKVLNGTFKTAWEEVLDSTDFAGPLSCKDDCLEAIISQLIFKFLNYKRPHLMQN